MFGGCYGFRLGSGPILTTRTKTTHELKIEELGKRGLSRDEERDPGNKLDQSMCQCNIFLSLLP